MPVTNTIMARGVRVCENGGDGFIDDADKIEGSDLAIIITKI